MRSALQQVHRLTDTVSLFFANIAAMVLLVLVAITCVDVIGRYFFNSPLVGAVELVEICMGAITFLIFLGVTAFIAFKLGLRVYDYAVRAFEDGDVTEYLLIPRYPIVGFVSAAIFSAALISILSFLVLLSQPGKVEPVADVDGA